MSANLPQPGWYEDPADPSRLRLWDGAAWTTEVRPAPTTEVVAPAPAAATAEPDPFVPLDLGAVSGGHGGSAARERQPEPDPFVPLDLGHVAGGHGGGARPAGGGLSAPEPSSALPGPSAADALPGPLADPTPEYGTEPGPVGRLDALVTGLRGRERPSWPVLSAGAAAIAALVATAAVTLGGGDSGPAVDPDAAYAACQARVTDITEVDGLEFAPHGEVVVTETAEGMALDFSALDPAGPQRRRQPVDLRCHVATADGRPSVTAVVVGLEQAGPAAAITP